MSYEEVDRVSRVQQVIDGRLAQRAAGTLLSLTSRQVRRLCKAYETHGPAGLASKRRGRPSNRRLAEALRREALELVRARYEGFGPTLAHEKLTEIHNLDISVETLRHWMSEDGLWVPRARRQSRLRRDVLQGSRAGHPPEWDTPIAVSDAPPSGRTPSQR